MSSPCITQSWRQFMAICRTTYLECLQHPVLLLLTMSGVVASALVPLLQFHEFGEAGRLSRDGVLAYQLTLGVIIAVVAASTSVDSEINDGTAATALSKPLRRDLFLLGKFAGVVGLLLQFWYTMLAVMLLAERIPYRFIVIDGEPTGVTDTRAQLYLFLITPLSLAIAGVLHYRLGKRFCLACFRLLAALATIGIILALCFNRYGTWQPSGNLDWRAVPVSILIMATLVVFAAIATSLATRVRAAAAMMITFVIMMLGLSADTIQLTTSIPHPIRLPLRLIPNLQSLWLSDALTGGGKLPLNYFLSALLYTFSLTVFVLALGFHSFRKREVN